MLKNIKNSKIIILDFGSQYTQLIAKCIRQLKVYCEIVPYTIDTKELISLQAKGIILSGGPDSVSSTSLKKVNICFEEIQVPILGICYGMQILNKYFGGNVETADSAEFGHAQVEITKKNILLDTVEDHINHNGNATLDVWMSHKDKVTLLANEFYAIANSNNCHYAAIAHKHKAIYGLQFHPEVSHTSQGKRILQRFIIDICNCDTNWTESNIVDTSISLIKQTIKQDEIILALSGGVDSSVTALLLHKAIGKQLLCIFVYNGLLRKDESEQVMLLFKKHLGLNIKKIEAKTEFLNNLENINDPEKKRKIIGNTFIKIFEQQANKNKDIKWLAQGTIYPDIIESSAGKNTTSHTIKSHHNVGGLPDNMQLELLEPLKALFKDEVRNIGKLLGLPYDMLQRHPFPGPGLAVRILGKISEQYIDIVQQADAIFIEILHKYNYYYKLSQAFAVFLPIKTVGITGDKRNYNYVISLRAVETIDFMTARWAKLPYELLQEASLRITNEIPHISRVVYDISDKPPATIEWE